MPDKGEQKLGKTILLIYMHILNSLKTKVDNFHSFVGTVSKPGEEGRETRGKWVNCTIPRDQTLHTPKRNRWDILDHSLIRFHLETFRGKFQFLQQNSKYTHVLRSTNLKIVDFIPILMDS